MKLLRLSLRNLWRNPRRTLFTAASLAVSLFLFCALVSVVTSLNANIEAAGKRPMAAILHRAGFTHFLPESYIPRIRRLPGVENVVASLYYGGHYGDTGGAQERFPSMGTDAVPEQRVMWGEDFKVSDETWTRWLGDRTGALVGPQLMRRFGWKVGQKITLKGTLWPVDMTFTISGPAWFRTDQSSFMLHREYLNEAIGNPGFVTMIWVQVKDTASLPAIAARIDAEFATSPDPVRTMSQKQLFMSFLGMLGDVRAIVSGIAFLVVIAVLFVTANSIALSARERVTEVAILKALGFSGGQVLASLLVEAITMTLAGGALGSALAFIVFKSYAFSIGFGPLSGFQVSAQTVAMGLGTAVTVGALAALGPASRAARRPALEGLRRAE